MKGNRQGSLLLSMHRLQNAELQSNEINCVIREETG